MRLITITLAVLLVLIQYPLWMGKGGFFRIRELSLQLEAAKEKNEENRLRNAKLASEVRDLEVGTEAIEERARYELGMIKKNEIFIQVIDTSKFPDKNKPVESSIVLPEKNDHTKAGNGEAAGKGVAPVSGSQTGAEKNEAVQGEKRR